MTTQIIKEKIIGSRNIGNFIIFFILLLAGIGFFLAGLSSYLNVNLLNTNASNNSNNFDFELKEFEKRLIKTENKYKVKPNISLEWVNKLRLRINKI